MEFFFLLLEENSVEPLEKVYNYLVYKQIQITTKNYTF